MRNSKKTEKIFIPSKKSDDWRSLLAKEWQWKEGHSAMALANCWQEANDFPTSVKKVFEESNIDIFNKRIELLLALPEYKVNLPGGDTASQNDIFILANGDGCLISITVEGKVNENFGPIIAEWKVGDKDNKTNKTERLEFLLNELNLGNKPIEDIRYQLLHRSVSAIIQARKFNTKYALMLVHSFSAEYRHFDEYERFVKLFGLNGKKNKLVGPVAIREVYLYFGWVKGEESYLRTKDK